MHRCLVLRLVVKVVGILFVVSLLFECGGFVLLVWRLCWLVILGLYLCLIACWLLIVLLLMLFSCLLWVVA